MPEPEPIVVGETPAGLYARLCIKFGAAGAGADNRTPFLASALVAGAQHVWYAALWNWRLRFADMETTAGQNYTELPEDFAGDADAGDWLVETAKRWTRPRYMHPRDFHAQSVFHAADPQPVPDYWTLGNEVVEDVPTPVIYWYPTPTSDVTFRGFMYWAKMPAFDETGEDIVFPEPRLDRLWNVAATSLAAADLTQYEGAKALSWPEVENLLTLAKAQYGHNMPPSLPVDKTRDSDDLLTGGLPVGPWFDAGGFMAGP